MLQKTSKVPSRHTGTSSKQRPLTWKQQLFPCIEFISWSCLTQGETQGPTNFTEKETIGWTAPRTHPRQSNQIAMEAWGVSMPRRCSILNTRRPCVRPCVRHIALCAGQRANVNEWQQIFNALGNHQHTIKKPWCKQAFKGGVNAAYSTRSDCHRGHWSCVLVVSMLFWRHTIEYNKGSQ